MNHLVSMIILIGFGLLVGASARADVPGQRPGYITEVSEERARHVEEMVLVPPPEPRVKTIWDRPLVDDKLSKEFQTQYRTKFGQTEAEIYYQSGNRYTFYDYPGGRQESVISHNERQQQFGNFMIRRLTENQVDQWAKSNPDVRPAYELKDRISNVNLEVRPGYKMKVQYSYSGNYFEFKLDNPYDVTTKTTMQMANGFDPGHIQKTILNVGYPWSKRTRIEVFHEIDRGSGSKFVGSHRLTKSLSTNLTATQNTVVDPDVRQPLQRHNLFLLGLAWSE